MTNSTKRLHWSKQTVRSSNSLVERIRSNIWTLLVHTVLHIIYAYIFEYVDHLFIGLERSPRILLETIYYYYLFASSSGKQNAFHMFNRCYVSMLMESIDWWRVERRVDRCILDTYFPIECIHFYYSHIDECRYLCMMYVNVVHTLGTLLFIRRLQFQKCQCLRVWIIFNSLKLLHSRCRCQNCNPLHCILNANAQTIAPSSIPIRVGERKMPK